MPPPLELTVLRILWREGESSVGEVREALAAKRELAYTTVMTLLDRLEKRGAVSRRRVGRGYRYQAALAREALLRVALARLVDDFFEGSHDGLLSYLRTHGLAADSRGGSERLDSALL